MTHKNRKPNEMLPTLTDALMEKNLKPDDTAQDIFLIVVGGLGIMAFVYVVVHIGSLVWVA